MIVSRCVSPPCQLASAQLDRERLQEVSARAPCFLGPWRLWFGNAIMHSHLPRIPHWTIALEILGNVFQKHAAIMNCESCRFASCFREVFGANGSLVCLGPTVGIFLQKKSRIKKLRKVFSWSFSRSLQLEAARWTCATPGRSLGRRGWYLR